jgi:TPR repeat protein
MNISRVFMVSAVFLGSSLSVLAQSPSVGPQSSVPEAGPAGTSMADLLESAKRLLLNGGSGGANFGEAVAYLEAAAESGSAEALALLGDAYRLGQYDRQLAPERAVGYYRQAANAGNAGALVKLGDMYRTGLPGLAADPDQAMAFYEEAIERGNNAARLRLLKNLLRAAPNTYVEIIQNRLTRVGLYHGPNHGLLSSPTISAFNQFCILEEGTPICRLGPLSPTVAEFVARSLVTE